MNRPIPKPPQVATPRALAFAALAFAAVAALVPLGTVVAQEEGYQEEGYRAPSEEIIRILDAPGLPDLEVSPEGSWAALLTRPAMVALEDIAEPRLHLAGYRLNPRTNGPAVAGRAPIEAMELIRLGDQHRVQLQLPAGAAVEYASWAPDGSVLLFSIVGPRGYELWKVEAGSATPSRVGAGYLNAAHGDPCRWMADSREALCRFVPEGRGAAPERPRVPSTPRIQEADGEPAPARTFQDLLQDGHDANLFEFYFTAQLAYVDVASGRTTPVGAPAIFDAVSPSPDGSHLYVVRTVRPFSYVVPDRWRTNDWFPREMEIWTRGGEMVRKVASLPLEENVAVDDSRSGPRGVTWQPGSDAALVWVEEIGGSGDGARDRVLRIDTPTSEPQVVLELDDHFDRMAWTRDGRGLVTEIDRFPRRAASWTRSWLVTPEAGGWSSRMVEDRSAEERFGAPGTPVTRGATLLGDGDWIFLQGDGVTPDGEQPFLDRMNLRTLATERLWESDPERYEVPVELVAGGVERLIIQSESPVDPPNFHLVETRAGVQVALTDLGDPAPQLQGVGRQVLTYARDDGIRLAGVVYTPPGWDGETRLPTVLWAYPREFVSPDAAAQVPGENRRFTRISGASHMFLLLEGYAIFDGPSIAILGGLTANDTYIEQLVSSTQAAVDAIVDAGIADRDRIGVGGHSYGGFMTANLLAHSDLFRAGVARSAAHNRTLTPFGFQNERRTIWEAPDVYMGMSPFMYAHQIEDPILLIHGADDANPGTFPVQSERMFHALKGMGKTSRLVMLNYEDHGYGARESILHTLWEMMDWFDRHVKHAPPRPTATEDGAG